MLLIEIFFQQTATKVPGRLRDLNYVERCKKLGLTNLKARRLRGDLIQQFKIAKGIEHIFFSSLKNCL
ncbi:RNA-directed DNA polymerase from mobile element jockey-like [Brachionus plicatilis]|uniref:RNA-directed DNA polymerase from mobile element jockey-like n=1 Tax=Brachionus plicatilis TaxID=10195 RepID=A0A3M7QGC6_BRAPC|nr:RNA-directed DNA polymerase from mobile element jockey-like [Brachionus plicatilis]